MKAGGADKLWGCKLRLHCAGWIVHCALSIVHCASWMRYKVWMKAGGATKLLGGKLRLHCAGCTLCTAAACTPGYRFQWG